MINYLPSYAAIAAYHHRIATPADLPAFLREVRDWARGPYAQALAQGQNLPDAERQAIAQKMSAYTGLPVDYILRSRPSRRTGGLPQGTAASTSA